jgi:hypothetical protein
MIRETRGWMDARTCRARAGGRGRRTCSRRHHPAATRSRQQRQHLAGMTPCRSQWEQWGSQETDAWGIRRCCMRSIGCSLGRRQPPRCARLRGGRRGDLTLVGSSVPVMRERGPWSWQNRRRRGVGDCEVCGFLGSLRERGRGRGRLRSGEKENGTFARCRGRRDSILGRRARVGRRGRAGAEWRGGAFEARHQTNHIVHRIGFEAYKGCF